MTYADLLRPTLQRTALAYDAVLILGASLLVAVYAQIAIPFQPVPITGQTFAVLLIGALLGSRRGALALTAYLIEGLAGLPVFAQGLAGPGVLAGPTGGYLIGFIAAAAGIGWLAERGWDRRIVTTAMAMLIGNVAIYLFGLPWLAARVGGWENALTFGLYPFLIGDLLKLALAAILLPAGWKLVGERPPR